MSVVRLASEPRVRSVSAAVRRADIDGLRALAVLLVVSYHVWFDRVSGGVDVFLLISAYLMTESAIRRAEAGRRIALLAGWGRRFARLLPPAAATILGVLLFAWLLMPESAWSTLWAQAWSSLLYVQNWELAATSVDYYARAEAVPSPLLHFWSLSVQAQVFVLWPILTVVAIAVGRRVGVAPRRALITVFGVVFAASLAYSILTTAVSQQTAYFDTGARLWEFALGSLAALAAPLVRPGARWAVAAGWVGLIGIVLCGAILDVEAGFPGIAALWPTLCAVAVLWCGRASASTGDEGEHGRTTPTRLLSARWLTALGRIAYPLYLVHWPILVGMLLLTGATRLDLVGGLVVVATSLLAAAVLDAAVIRPLAGRPPVKAWRTIGIAVLVVAVPLAAWQGVDRVRNIFVDVVPNPGAAVLLPGATVAVSRGAPITPRATLLHEEWVDFGGDCADDVRPADPAAYEECTAHRSSREDAPTVLVVGNSHARQWSGAILPIAMAEDWNLVGIFKGWCSLTPPIDGDGAEDPAVDPAVDSADCASWRTAATAYAEDFPADVVMVVGSRTTAEFPDEAAVPGLDELAGGIVSSGSDVVVLRDTPRFHGDQFLCVEAEGVSPSVCDRPRGDVLAATSPIADLAAREGVHTLDISDELCPDGLCRAEIGNVAVYMDDNHVSRTFAETLAPFVRDQLQGVSRLFPAV